VVRRLRRGGHSRRPRGAVAAGIPAFARELGRPPRVKRRKHLSTPVSTLRGPRAATFPRCRRLRARDPRGALSTCGWVRRTPIGGGSLTRVVGCWVARRASSGCRCAQLPAWPCGAVIGRNHSDAWVGCIGCSPTASSSTESAWRSTCSRRRGGHNASTVRAGSWRRLKRRSTTSAPTALRPSAGPAHGGTAAPTPAQPTTRGRPPPMPGRSSGSVTSYDGWPPKATR
jgi:hypothetical protein